MNELNNLSQEVRRRVAREEITQQMKRTERVNGWLQRVEVLERQVEVILQNNSQELQKKCLLNCFPRNCSCSYRLGKDLPRAPVDEMPMENITVGLDPLLEEVGEETLRSHPDIPELAKIVAEECEEIVSFFAPYSLEDYNIRKDELINLWIGEGLLDELQNIHDESNLGEFIVGTLKLACLLESDESEEFVRMHDMIRDMALWVANTKRISVWGHHDPNSIESFTGEPLCPNLLTLLVKDTMLKTFSNEFFQSMHALKVLDLSGNRGLTKLPKSIDYTKKLKEISTEGISSLSCLQVFSMVTDEFNFYGSETALYDEQALLEELERLKLGDLRITIRSASGAKKVMESPMLQKCLKKLSINNCCDFICLELSSSSLERMNRLVKLEITFYATWLIYAPCLQKLTIADCSSMKTVIQIEDDKQSEDGEIHVDQCVSLEKLPLNASSASGLKQTLIEIHVDQCESLRKLPLNAGSASGLKQIKGTKSWWNQLQWEDNAIEEAFGSKFIEIPNYDDK
uniref:Disease resistance protein winged helix domain-containing protein n=1 Tax=Fagus sylvatica TaxID=28930 RepID=A0A2N9F4U4_FAGSY